MTNIVVTISATLGEGTTAADYGRALGRRLGDIIAWDKLNVTEYGYHVTDLDALDAVTEEDLTDVFGQATDCPIDGGYACQEEPCCLNETESVYEIALDEFPAETGPIIYIENYFAGNS